MAALGGGLAIQHRMAYQGEYFIQRYGLGAADAKPPVARMLQGGVPVGAGTDATRVASYNPWTALWWLVTGRTVGGVRLASEDNRLSREEALRRYTEGSAWFTGEEDLKGRIAPGQLADAAVLSDDYFEVPEDEIRGITSVLTVLGGEVVWADGDFRPLAPASLPVSPSWSPVGRWGGWGAPGPAARSTVETGHTHSAACGCSTPFQTRVRRGGDEGLGSTGRLVGAGL